MDSFLAGNATDRKKGHSPRHTVAMAVAVVSFACLCAATGLCVRFGAIWALVALVGASVAWLIVDGPVEGPTLLVLSPSHGVTMADLAVVAAWAGVCARLVWRRYGQGAYDVRWPWG